MFQKMKEFSRNEYWDVETMGDGNMIYVTSGFKRNKSNYDDASKPWEGGR